MGPYGLLYLISGSILKVRCARSISGIGHELLRIVRHYVPQILSTLDPASTLAMRDVSGTDRRTEAKQLTSYVALLHTPISPSYRRERAMS